MIKNAKSGGRTSGFSLIELMIVLVISLVVAAFALPNMTLAINNIRLRGTLSGIAGILQETRITAVKQNRYAVARNATDATGANLFFTDLDWNNAYTPAAGTKAGEPVIQAAQGVVFATTPPTAFPSATLLGANFLPTASTIFNVGFTARGLPCTPTGGNPTTGTPTGCDTAGATVGYLIYFKYSGAFGDSWGAITITPAGRVRSWTLSGTTWS